MLYIMCCRSNVNSAFRTIHKCTKHFKDIPGCFDVATEIKKQIEDFKPFIPLIQGLRNQGMRNRHWEQVCIHVYVYMYVSSVCVCMCVYIYVCVCMYVRMYVCMYVCMQVHTYIHMSCTFLCLRICIYVYVYFHVYTCLCIFCIFTYVIYM